MVPKPGLYHPNNTNDLTAPTPNCSCASKIFPGRAILQFSKFMVIYLVYHKSLDHAGYNLLDTVFAQLKRLFPLLFYGGLNPMEEEATS